MSILKNVSGALVILLLGGLAIAGGMFGWSLGASYISSPTDVDLTIGVIVWALTVVGEVLIIQLIGLLAGKFGLLRL